MSFWQKLSKLKLDEYMLDEGPKRYWLLRPVEINQRAIKGEAEWGLIPRKGTSGEDHVSVTCECAAQGTLLNLNTLEAFKAADKSGILKSMATKVWEAVRSGDAERDPSCLASFVLLCFSDLKSTSMYTGLRLRRL